MVNPREISRKKHFRNSVQNGQMLNTSARLLRLLSLLQVRPDWTGPELAARLGVSTPDGPQ